MRKIDKHIEIVSSGLGAFSCMGPSSRQSIHAILAQRYRSVGITLITTPADLEALVILNPDLVFLGMKYLPTNLALGANDPDKIWISEYLDRAGIAYTGSAGPAVRLEASKQLAKQHVLDSGLATPSYEVIRHDADLSTQTMPASFPVFVKPSNRGGGEGIGTDSLARNAVELREKVRAITTVLNADALIEGYLPGREFSVSVLAHPDSEGKSVMPVEMVTEADERGARILGQKVKSSNVEQVLDVPVSPLRQSVCDFALDVFNAIGVRDYGRIDIRLDSYGVPHFLEANLYPSLISGYGSFPKAYAFNTDQPYEQMILTIAQLGLARAADDVEELPALFGELVTA